MSLGVGYAGGLPVAALLWVVTLAGALLRDGGHRGRADPARREP